MIQHFFVHTNSLVNLITGKDIFRHKPPSTHFKKNVTFGDRRLAKHSCVQYALFGGNIRILLVCSLVKKGGTVTNKFTFTERNPRHKTEGLPGITEPKLKLSFYSLCACHFFFNLIYENICECIVISDCSVQEGVCA
jgi:hypothetical protein